MFYIKKTSSFVLAAAVIFCIANSNRLKTVLITTQMTHNNVVHCKFLPRMRLNHKVTWYLLTWVQESIYIYYRYTQPHNPQPFDYESKRYTIKLEVTDPDTLLP